ncbi:GNAT family N-acetyltransferase [Brevibacillus choshinensis]|uniref:GNAT family N-acetyltransferase n=1 Tax=Brevibacillus choshinensis TaxID=54911 RepID=A0ABX7FXL3_BRECH|nr:GNAT family N-acetyltransferase [Brevibacillus choshinensis]QRG70550.1 GNAT family N-acetyltransferase [Brevibacillus choshinensis]
MNCDQVEIVAVDAENWYPCCQLEVAKSQIGHIESNAVSIAQSKFEPTLMPYAILLDGEVVGFLMFNSVPEELDGYWIYRIMVDQNYQNRGIGKRAASLMIQEMKKLPGAKRIVVGYHPENKEAHQLYAGLGFVDRGDRFGKEMAVVLDL